MFFLLPSFSFLRTVNFDLSWTWVDMALFCAARQNRYFLPSGLFWTAVPVSTMLLSLYVFHGKFLTPQKSKLSLCLALCFWLRTAFLSLGRPPSPMQIMLAEKSQAGHSREQGKTCLVSIGARISSGKWWVNKHLTYIVCTRGWCPWSPSSLGQF